MKIKSLWIVQILYAFLVPAQIFSALKFQSGEIIFAWGIVCSIMIMEIFGIKYWIIAQSENLNNKK